MCCLLCCPAILEDENRSKIKDAGMLHRSNLFASGQLR
jgi:hypothetical protein